MQSKALVYTRRKANVQQRLDSVSKELETKEKNLSTRPLLLLRGSAKQRGELD